jgi:hypothetical protein
MPLQPRLSPWCNHAAMPLKLRHACQCHCVPQWPQNHRQSATPHTNATTVLHGHNTTDLSMSSYSSVATGSSTKLSSSSSHRGRGILDKHPCMIVGTALRSNYGQQAHKQHVHIIHMCAQFIAFDRAARCVWAAGSVVHASMKSSAGNMEYVVSTHAHKVSAQSCTACMCNIFQRVCAHVYDECVPCGIHIHVHVFVSKHSRFHERQCADGVVLAPRQQQRHGRHQHPAAQGHMHAKVGWQKKQSAREKQKQSHRQWTLRA